MSDFMTLPKRVPEEFCDGALDALSTHSSDKIEQMSERDKKMCCTQLLDKILEWNKLSQDEKSKLIKLTMMSTEDFTAHIGRGARLPRRKPEGPEELKAR